MIAFSVGKSHRFISYCLYKMPFGFFSSKPAAPGDKTTLIDTTLRPICMDISPEIEMSTARLPKGILSNPLAPGQLTIANRVTEEQYGTWYRTLELMAQLSRLIYCDAGMLFDCLKDFGSLSNKDMNDTITANNKQRLGQRFLANREAGALPTSYKMPAAPENSSDSMGTYISTPGDVTCMVLKCSAFPSLPNRVFRGPDIMMAFKGSSTMENFKHDLYSQFSRGKLSELAKDIIDNPGDIPDDWVTKSFADMLIANWNTLSELLRVYTPTSGCRLFITGHSLGGAYATIFGFLVALAKSKFPNIESVHIVTFGAPTLFGDGARNLFNKQLDSKYLTLDRVASYQTLGVKKYLDPVVVIPVGFSHPGFRPLNPPGEMPFPESRTGRAYNIQTIKKVFQNGGVLGGPQKEQYMKETLTHMPNLVFLQTGSLGGLFPHGSYLNMTFLGGFRILGMPNPGNKRNGTYQCDFFKDQGIQSRFIPPNTEPAVSAEPTAKEMPDPAKLVKEIPAAVEAEGEDPQPPTAGKRKTRRRSSKKSRKTRRRY
jgi:hypothetical protein